LVVGRVAGLDAQHPDFIFIDAPVTFAVGLLFFSGNGQGRVVQRGGHVQHVDGRRVCGFIAVVIRGNSRDVHGAFLRGYERAVGLREAFRAVQARPRHGDLLAGGGCRVDVADVHGLDRDGGLHVHRWGVNEIEAWWTVENFNLYRKVVDVQFFIDNEDVHRPHAAVGPVPLRPAARRFNHLDQAGT